MGCPSARKGRLRQDEHVPHRLGTPPLTPGRLLEIKFDHALPTALERVVEALGLEAQAVSKYRLAVENA